MASVFSIAGHGGDHGQDLNCRFFDHCKTSILATWGVREIKGPALGNKRR